VTSTQEERVVAALERIAAALERGGGAGAGAAATSGNGAGGLCFPAYGKSKGQQVKGARKGDLEFYKNGCLRTLRDPGKSRFHAKERQLLAAINTELGLAADAGLEDDGGSEGPPPDFGPDGDDVAF
jgi:hypothetical protein